MIFTILSSYTIYLEIKKHKQHLTKVCHYDPRKTQRAWIMNSDSDDWWPKLCNCISGNYIGGADVFTSITNTTLSTSEHCCTYSDSMHARYGSASTPHFALKVCDSTLRRISSDTKPLNNSNSAGVPLQEMQSPGLCSDSLRWACCMTHIWFLDGRVAQLLHNNKCTLFKRIMRAYDNECWDIAAVCETLSNLAHQYDHSATEPIPSVCWTTLASSTGPTTTHLYANTADVSTIA